MCANYLPSKAEQLQGHFGVAAPDSSYVAESFPGTLSPLIRKPRAQASFGERSAALAMFGMVPHWAEKKLARHTYNARSETLAVKPSFRNAFKLAQFCVVPAEAIFEPCYETGKAQRFAIRRADGAPLGIAGIWERKPGRGDEMPLLSFSMLTINADEHPLMQRFHKSGDEKRMLVFLHPERYDDWLHCPLAAAHEFFVPYPAELLVAQPAARPAQATLELPDA